MTHPGDYCSDTCPCDIPCDLAARLAGLEATDGMPAAIETRTPNEARAAGRRSWDHGPMYDRVIDNLRASAAAFGAPDEVRVVDPVTGGEKGQKLGRFDLLPADALRATAEHFGRGARKYEDRNWEKGYAWGLSFGAMMRHLWAWWGGEEIDAETGSHHLAAATFHGLALQAFVLRGIGTDDRRLRSTPPLDLGA